MDEKKDMRDFMERMEESNRQQALFAKLQCLFSVIAAVCCIAILVAVLGVLPQLKDTVKQVDAVLANVESVSGQLAEANVSAVMDNLEDVTAQLAEADLGGMAEDVSELVHTSQSGVEEALAKLNKIDLETLNKAIEDLAAVVEPLANFFGRFG